MNESSFGISRLQTIKSWWPIDHQALTPGNTEGQKHKWSLTNPELLIGRQSRQQELVRGLEAFIGWQQHVADLTMCTTGLLQPGAHLGHIALDKKQGILEHVSHPVCDVYKHDSRKAWFTVTRNKRRCQTYSHGGATVAAKQHSFQCGCILAFGCCPRCFWLLRHTETRKVRQSIKWYPCLL